MLSVKELQEIRTGIEDLSACQEEVIFDYHKAPDPDLIYTDCVEKTDVDVGLHV